MSINKEELAKVNEYSAIDANYEAEEKNLLYIRPIYNRRTFGIRC